MTDCISDPLGSTLRTTSTPTAARARAAATCPTGPSTRTRRTTTCSDSSRATSRSCKTLTARMPWPCLTTTTTTTRGRHPFPTPLRRLIRSFSRFESTRDLRIQYKELLKAKQCRPRVCLGRGTNNEQVLEKRGDSTWLSLEILDIQYAAVHHTWLLLQLQYQLVTVATRHSILCPIPLFAVLKWQHKIPYTVGCPYTPPTALLVAHPITNHHPMKDKYPGSTCGISFVNPRNGVAKSAHMP